MNIVYQQIAYAIGGDALNIKDRVKLVSGALLFPRATKRWVNFVQSTPLLRDGSMAYPQLFTKIYRPYLTAGLSCTQRVDALIAHYRSLHELGLEQLIGRAMRQAEPLYQGCTKSDGRFALTLSAVHAGHREGEVCLHLLYREQALFSLNFVLARNEGRLVMQVGRLQGPSDARARELVREATREFHACRPGNVLVTAARQLAALLGCVSVLLVSNQQRIAINLWRRWRISANYDQTWIELGASRRADGFFEIKPQTLQDQDYSDIASKKRSGVRKNAPC